jgi:GNAT superfamily N-acetyltransferase
MERTDNNYKISSDKSLLSLNKICEMLGKCYWSSARPREIIAKSIENSICYGVYHQGEQVGFCRIITDYATTYYICDVVIDEKYKGLGLGKKLVKCLIEHENFGEKMRGMLATKDAHGLYSQCGFIIDDKSFMRRFPKIAD